jgi:hypothetical protein
MTTITVTPLYQEAFEKASQIAKLRHDWQCTVIPRNPLVPQQASVLPAATLSIDRCNFSDMAALWRATIQAEGLRDVVIDDIRTLRMNPQDGTIGTPQSMGQAYTTHGFGQIWEMLGQKAASYVLSVSNHARAVLFNDAVQAAPKKVSAIMRLTTDAAVLGGTRRVNQGKLWCIRGCVTKRHSLEFFDDMHIQQALYDYLRKHGLDSMATARVSRGTNRTWGNVEFSGVHVKGVYRGISFKNSEVGCVSWGFTGSITIRALNDAVIESPYKRPTEITIDAAASGSSNRHTLPQGINRHAEATGRMNESMRKATESAEKLLALWEKAFALQVIPGAPEAFKADEVYIDAIEEHMGFQDAEERARFTEGLKDDKAAVNFSRGTVAHVVGVFAIMGERQRAYEVLRQLAK